MRVEDVRERLRAQRAQLVGEADRHNGLTFDEVGELVGAPVDTLPDREAIKGALSAERWTARLEYRNGRIESAGSMGKRQAGRIDPASGAGDGRNK